MNEYCQPYPTKKDGAMGKPGSSLRARRRGQGGIALIVGLVLLVVMSMIGVTMMSTNNLETQMSGGEREANIAFQAAEAALRDAEAYIEDTSGLEESFPARSPAHEVPKGIVGADADEPDFFEMSTWDPDKEGYMEYMAGAAEEDRYPEVSWSGQPRYIIKHVANVQEPGTERKAIEVKTYEDAETLPVVSVFRITSRATSRDGSAVRLLQSTWGRIY